MDNKWKISFFVLLGIVIFFLVSILIMVMRPVHSPEDSVERQPLTESGEKQVSFLVRTNKADLTRVINHYLVSEGFTGPIDYKVIVKDEVELYGTFPVFGQELEMMLTFEPQALENGDLVLNQKSISLGSLNLPVSNVMKIIQSNYSLPDWVRFQPNEKKVYVSLQEMELKSDIKVRATSFDLKRDDISFTLLIPVD
ncbi:YpmS family protein [Mesobacillus maritimus]|uniref:YpmS family protein n=1 Tax=Mesobacillus maritimus TaxID=1643336 RepID=UPI00203EA8D4|nr:YpmS family protein [Mesobacillus maritimus]MCM3588658.1 YpmS family protein [Mesobacillus maritimus]